MRRTFFPYMVFCFITPNRSQGASSASESSSKGNLIVLGAQIQRELAAAEDAAEAKCAAGGVKTEVGDRLSQHFQWSSDPS
jgi:hypothetical protein